MDRLTHERASGIKSGYWSPAKKEELVQRLAAYEDTGLEPEEVKKACKKQNPMRVKDVHIDEYYCPKCGRENNCDNGIVYDNYCPICGQKFDWGDRDDDQI